MEDALRAIKRPAEEETAYSKAAKAFEKAENIKVGHLQAISASTQEMATLMARQVVALERLATAQEAMLQFLTRQHKDD